MLLSQPVADERYPVPPEDLRWRATGSPDAETFLRSGAAELGFLDEALRSERKSLRDFSSILDFGCGCGRLTRALRSFCDPWGEIHGTDIDADAIRWCKENIPDATFSLNAENPPLTFREGSIDLVIARSVFTHLDADRQFRWLAELQRIMKPGGYLLATFRHDASPAVQAGAPADSEGKSFVFMATDAWKGAFPAWYGEAYHAPDYVRKNWGSYFEVCHIIAPGAIPEETAILRARESTFMQRLFQRH
jgi:SAM-dependent methyltransferase